MPASRYHELPPRLRPVLVELIKGQTNAEIASSCALTVHTIEKYVSDLLAFFQCRNRTELISRTLRGEFGDLTDFGEVSV
ncbi:MAG: hypothetical protein KC482_08435 [Dehalococcoidia bacterium]|nr:hypothetical protein [Dehalococcoidia bacterium]MCA9853610.1 hypothetical protein [Dehalococcoidia bacterium]